MCMFGILGLSCEALLLRGAPGGFGSKGGFKGSLNQPLFGVNPF